jgi:uroporphyrinogen-III decarboxylase
MKVFLHSCGAEPFIYDLAEHVQPSHFMNWWDRGPRSHPLKEAKEKLDKKIAMCAGLDQNNTILEGPDAIEAEAKDAIETVAPLPFILGVGCFMPTKPNYDDLKAASRATKKYGKYPLKG